MKSDCRGHRTKFSEYLDGELAEPQAAALEAHLQECGECRHELEKWRRTIQAVAALPARRPQGGFADRVVRRLGEQRRGVARPGGLIVLWTRALPVAAMFLLVLGLTFSVHRRAPVGVDPGVRRLALDRERAAQPAQPAVVGKPAAVLADGLVAGLREEKEAPAAPAEVGAAGDFLGLRFESDARKALPVVEGAMGVALGPAPAVAGEAAEAPALSFRALDTASRGRRSRGWEARPVLFTQVSAREPARVREPVQQVLSLVGTDPAGLARRAVTVANEEGLTAALALSGTGERGTVDVYLAVPPAQYDDLLRALAALTPPEGQALANTAAASSEFFRNAKWDYDAMQARRAPRAPTSELARATRGAGVPRAAALAARAGLKESLDENAMARRDKELTERLPSAQPALPEKPINLLIRIGRPEALTLEAE